MSLITVNLGLVSPYGNNDTPLAASGSVQFTPTTRGKYNGSFRTIETVTTTIVMGKMSPVELTPGEWKMKVIPAKGSAWPDMTFTLEEGMPEPVNLADIFPDS